MQVVCPTWVNRLFLWVLLPALAMLWLAHGAEAKRLKIPVTAITSPADSLEYSLEPFPYRIAPGDQLLVDYGIILDGQPITADATVRPDGAVTLPRVGDVLVAGRSTTEVDSVLAQLYADVYINPDITVAVREVAGNQVHVLGQVRNPGSYEKTPNMSALQAIASAGGFQDDAAKGSVIVMRRTGPNSLITKKIDLHDAVQRGASAQDVYLRRYDIVYVNRNAIGDVNLFVDRFFRNMLPVVDMYIRGWQAFNMERVYPSTERLIIETPASP
jgi:protein involved in polysaccharide export with SLBB domain